MGGPPVTVSIAALFLGFVVILFGFLQAGIRLAGDVRAKRSLVSVLASDDLLYRKILSQVEELHGRKGFQYSDIASLAGFFEVAVARLSQDLRERASAALRQQSEIARANYI